MRIDYSYLQHATVTVKGTMDVPDHIVQAGAYKVYDYIDKHDPQETSHEVTSWAAIVKPSFKFSSRPSPQDLLPTIRRIIATLADSADDLEVLDAAMRDARAVSNRPAASEKEAAAWVALHAALRLYDNDPDGRFTARLVRGILGTAV